MARSEHALPERLAHAFPNPGALLGARRRTGGRLQRPAARVPAAHAPRSTEHLWLEHHVTVLGGHVVPGHGVEVTAQPAQTA